MIKKLICGSGDGTQGFLQTGKHATHPANFLLGGSSFHFQGWVDLTLKDLILRQPLGMLPCPDTVGPQGCHLLLPSVHLLVISSVLLQPWEVGQNSSYHHQLTRAQDSRSCDPSLWFQSLTVFCTQAAGPLDLQEHSVVVAYTLTDDRVFLWVLWMRIPLGLGD